MNRGPGSRLDYAAIAVALLLVELFIVRNAAPGSFVRTSLGDVLVIALVHCVLRAVLAWPAGITALLATSAGFVVEGAQALHVVRLLGLAPDSFLRLVIGDTASVGDLVMYVLGGVSAFALDTLARRSRRRRRSRRHRRSGGPHSGGPRSGGRRSGGRRSGGTAPDSRISPPGPP